MKTFHQSSLTFCFAVLFSMIVMVGQAYADCTNPAGTEGQQIYNTTYNAMQFCNGTNWVAMTGGVAGDNLGNHTAISDLDMGTNSITNVLDPVAAQDAATKAYVDANAGGSAGTVVGGGQERYLGCSSWGDSTCSAYTFVCNPGSTKRALTYGGSYPPYLCIKN